MTKCLMLGYIVFTEDSFDKPYSEQSRTYVVSSNNKAYQAGMGGYSIYASCLDGTDPCVRLESYMVAEKGGKNGWKIERCYTQEQEREMIDIIAGPCFICDCSGENFGSLNEEQQRKYTEMFKKLLGVSRAEAYRIIKRLNDQLSSRGFIVVNGRVNRNTLKSKFTVSVTITSKEVNKMGAYKDKNGTWYAQFRFTNWKGEPDRKTKRGFATKREALDWERDFLTQSSGNLEMTFEAFYELYKKNMKERIKLSTWNMKESVIEGKILPYFKRKRMCDIKPRDVVEWQNTLIKNGTENGEPYSPVYLKTIHNQLSAIFNHAVKFYDLPSNPARKAGNMGKEKSREMLFWTQSEYKAFSEAIMDKPISFYAFEVLYWGGLRLGEMLALTKKDIDFKRGIIRITKSFQRIKGEDLITDPKTPNSVRNVQMPDFLAEELKDYIGSLYGVEDGDRIFPITKSYLHHEMKRGCEASGVKKIRIHDLRHSHVSLLIDMGFSAVAIANRVGHESIDITYRYAHLFPTRQNDMADKLNMMRS